MGTERVPRIRCPDLPNGASGAAQQGVHPVGDEVAGRGMLDGVSAETMGVFVPTNAVEGYNRQ